MKEKLSNDIENIIQGKSNKKENDFYLDLAKKQGYVPQECKLPGQIVMGLINESKNPCDGCNISDCKNYKWRIK